MAGEGDTELPQTPLPPVPSAVASEHPELWRAYQLLGKAAAEAGPLDVRQRHLIGLALAIGAGSEGAAHSHTRRGMAEGLTADELEHVALLAITTLGWPQAMKGLSWVRDVTRKKCG